MKVLVAYDGSLNSKIALRQGISKAKDHNGVLIVLHVFHRAMFIDHELGHWTERIARAEAARYLEEARKIINEEGGDIFTRIVEIDGNPEEEIIDYARNVGIDIIFSPRHYRKFAKEILCPVYIIPQQILNPAGAV